MPLTIRKTHLARLLARRIDGIFISDFERGEIGPELFRHTCLMGLELPDRSVRRLPQGAQRDERNPVASIAFCFEQIESAIDGVANCGLGLRIAGRRHCRAAGPHDRVPSFALYAKDNLTLNPNEIDWDRTVKSWKWF